MIQLHTQNKHVARYALLVRNTFVLLNQSLDSSFVFQSCLYQRCNSIDSPTCNSYYPLFVVIKGGGFPQQLSACIQLCQLQLTHLFCFGPSDFNKTPNSMVDKWSILMDSMLDLVHDTNVEGYGGEFLTVLTSTSEGLQHSFAWI